MHRIATRRLALAAALAALAGATGGAGGAHAQCLYQRFIGPDIDPNNWAGESVAIEGDFMLFGEPNVDATSPDSGRVSIYERNAANNWIFAGYCRAPLAGDNSNDRFGSAVAYSAGVGLAGAPYGGPSDAGSVCFFIDTGPALWTVKSTITPPDAAAFDNFGRAVAISGDHAVVGAPFHDKVEALTLADTGGAYFYKRNPDDTWSANGKASEPFTFLRSAGDHFGAAVAMHDNLAIVSCPDGAQVTPAGSGWVRVYKRSGSTWSVLTTLSAPGAQAGGGFGRSIAYDGEFLVVGAPETDFVEEDGGKAYVYRRWGDAFTLEGELSVEFPNPFTGFGQRVAVANARVAVSTVEQTVVYFHRTPAGAWVRDHTIIDPDATGSNERFGFSLAASGGDLMIGDPYDDNSGSIEGGAAYWMPFGFGADVAGQAARIRIGDTLMGCTDEAANDGAATCGQSSTSRDVWYALTVPNARTVALSTLGSEFDTVLSVHSAAPGNAANQIVCNDDYAAPERWSRVVFNAQPGMLYFVRVAGYLGAFGDYTLAATASVSCPGDANGDGAIGFADLNIVLSQFNMPGANPAGDFDLDGDVDFADLNTVISNFNGNCN